VRPYLYPLGYRGPQGDSAPRGPDIKYRSTGHGVADEVEARQASTSTGEVEACLTSTSSPHFHLSPRFHLIASLQPIASLPSPRFHLIVHVGGYRLEPPIAGVGRD
jgi:hypothetical protein